MPRREALSTIARRLRAESAALRFSPPVTHVYRPMEYAWSPHRRYLARYGPGTGRVLLVGMNPGPFGMAQTGVPFGEVALVRDWLGIEGRVEQPRRVHPKRPVLGFECTRAEVSGRRLWGWARSRYRTPARFFERFFVWNYCPLCFMEVSGRNRTPDKLPAGERDALFAVCDRALAAFMDVLQPTHAIGVGRFATRRIEAVARRRDLVVGAAPHPSPASPAANRGWAPLFEAALEALGVGLD